MDSRLRGRDDLWDGGINRQPPPEYLTGKHIMFFGHRAAHKIWREHWERLEGC